MEVLQTPAWASGRTNLTGRPRREDITTDSSNAFTFAALPLRAQEQTILEDLLFVLLGIEGRYIKLTPTKTETCLAQFHVDPTLDPSLADLIHRMLPLCSQYMFISTYIEANTQFVRSTSTGTTPTGKVLHAFCAALRQLLKEYHVVVAQLEHQFFLGRLSLQKCWYFLGPSMKTMLLLYRITSEASSVGATGGRLLNLLYTATKTLGGDAHSKELLEQLLQRAFAPYGEMLDAWLYRGVIEDPFGEFLVAEDTLAGGAAPDDSYGWSGRYSLRSKEYIPQFLEKFSEKILVTGKYLNVIRACGAVSMATAAATTKEVLLEGHRGASFSINEREFAEAIDRAHTFASQKLLTLLIKEQRLIDRLRSLKHYFLMDTGDLFVHFLDAAEDELAKPASSIQPTRLESLLDLSLRSSVVSSLDDFREDLTCTLMPYDLIKQLIAIVTPTSPTASTATSSAAATPTVTIATPVITGALTGFEAFTVDYSVKFPLSLVVTRQCLNKYQAIFRFLFQCKRVERDLCNGWSYTQTLKELELVLHHKSKGVLGICFHLQRQMLHFVQGICHHAMLEIIEPNWVAMEKQILKATTVDEVLQSHSAFLDNCLKGCMLMEPRLIRTLSKQLHTSKLFSDFCIRFVKSLEIGPFGESTGPSGTAAEATASTTGSAARRASAMATARRSRAAVTTEHAAKVTSDPGFVRTVQKFQESFHGNVRLLLELLGALHASVADYGQQMARLRDRLDFNDFYGTRKSAGGMGMAGQAGAMAAPLGAVAGTVKIAAQAAAKQPAE